MKKRYQTYETKKMKTFNDLFHIEFQFTAYNL